MHNFVYTLVISRVNVCSFIKQPSIYKAATQILVTWKCGCIVLSEDIVGVEGVHKLEFVSKSHVVNIWFLTSFINYYLGMQSVGSEWFYLYISILIKFYHFRNGIGLQFSVFILCIFWCPFKWTDANSLQWLLKTSSKQNVQVYCDTRNRWFL